MAYDNLFASEIFTYPESLPQVERLGLYDETEFHEGATSLSQRADIPIQDGGIDGAPSTLAQILYLSYKNHGQFLLDLLTNRFQKDSREITLQDGASKIILSSLRRLVEALDRDDTDLGLWRQVARICEPLGSIRIARYCLEAVLTADRDGTDHWSELLSLDRIFAAEQLKALLGAKSWESKIAILPASEKHVGGPLKRYIDPCPYLPHEPHAISDHKSRQEQSISLIKVETRSWNSCGKSLMFQICQEGRGLDATAAEARYSLQLPNKQKLSTQQRAGVSEEKWPGLGINCNTGDSALRPGTGGHPNAGSRASSILDEKTGLEPAAYVYTIDSDDEGQNREAAASNVPSMLKDSGPVHSVHVAPQNLREGGFDTKDDQVDQLHAAAQVEEQLGSLEATPNLPAAVSLPTRKRSSDSAGLQENTDIGRARSKRIKARGSTNELNHFKEVSTEELNQLYDDQLRVTDQADRLLFDAARVILAKFEVEHPESFDTFKEAMSPLLSRGNLIGNASKLDPTIVAARDFLNLLATWDKENTTALLHGDSLDGKLGGSSNLRGPRNSALNLFLEHSKRGSEFGSQKPLLPDDEGLEAFAVEIEQSWTYLDQLALKWIEALLAPRRTEETGADSESIYEHFVWPETLKRTVVLMLVMKDEYIYSDIYSRLKRLDARLLEAATCDRFDGLQGSEEDLIQTVQNIFELHLDTYGKIINPSSEVDPPTRILQLDRLGRWAALAHDAISKKPSSDNPDHTLENLEIRFLWASVLHTSLIDPTSREHTILCFRDLKRVLKEAGSPVIELANNCMMPEISDEAAEREISRVTTMDFFLNLFNNQESNPFMIIEGLEAILEESVQFQGSVSPDSTNDDKLDPAIDQGEKGNPSTEQPRDVSSKQEDLKQMLQFVDRANISLKDILWEKLGEAYEAIAYPPKALSCLLRRIEIIAEYFVSDSFITKSTSDRYSSLLRWLRVAGDLITKALTLILNETGIFHFIDEAHLCSAMKATVYFQRILHVQMFWEDSIRVGKVPPPRPNNAHEEFESALNKIRDMLVRTWILQYSLIKEAYEQNPHVSTEPKQDLSEYLECLHHALGLRNFCKVSERLFPIFMVRELMQLKIPESSGISMAQLIYDLYGLKICSNPAYLEDHGCPTAPLERETAFEIIDLVMAQARRMNIKDIGKSELKTVIDKMQHAIGLPKPTAAMVFNRRVAAAFLKSPINPVDLYRSLQGIGDLSGTAVSNYSSVGDKGWYLLMGHITLAKFRSQKRLFLGPVEELELANGYFRQDLELGLGKWETWYRLGQVLDAMIEEGTTWTAEKLNSKMAELVSLQRNAIHCYAMAVAAASRDEDASCEAADKISELYADFACRIYASSREPFSMEAFALQDFTKHYNGEARGMYKGYPFRIMQVYSAWKFASVLFQRALGHKEGSWM